MKKSNKKENSIMKEEIRYKMSKDLAKSLLAARSNGEKKKNPQAYLCEYVNREFGLKGFCVEVVLY